MYIRHKMSAGLDIGSTHALRSSTHGQYLNNGDLGNVGGGTITSTDTSRMSEMYENIFGPAGRDIKVDSQRHKRHQRWHLPDALKGHNQFLTDRIDGLITDSTNSPFTRNILPYKYLENPDQKLKWNVYSFDEGMASRTPYESAARVLPQSKRSFAGYTVRHGLAIAMEHNFMMSETGRTNFKHQLTQLVGSIQLTNDLDVHIALLQAPSHQKYMNERYHDQFKTTAQICREYVDLFGIMQKTQNALDILIEDAKNTLKTWGAAAPNFLMCNGALTTQLTMTPEATNYLTNGLDGKANLKKGPDLPSYRGLSIINSRKFSMETGTAPRDLLRRRVRVGEYYHIVWTPRAETSEYEFYDQSRDTMFRLSYQQLLDMSKMNSDVWGMNNNKYKFDNTSYWTIAPPNNDNLTRPTGRSWNPEKGGLVGLTDEPTYTAVGTLGTQKVNVEMHAGKRSAILFHPLMKHSSGLGSGKFRLKSVSMPLTCSLPSEMCCGTDIVRYDIMSEAYGAGIFRHPFNVNALNDMSPSRHYYECRMNPAAPHNWRPVEVPRPPNQHTKANLLTEFTNLASHLPFNHAQGMLWDAAITYESTNPLAMTHTFCRLYDCLPKGLHDMTMDDTIDVTDPYTGNPTATKPNFALKFLCYNIQAKRDLLSSTEPISQFLNTLTREQRLEIIQKTMADVQDDSVSRVYTLSADAMLIAQYLQGQLIQFLRDSGINLQVENLVQTFGDRVLACRGSFTPEGQAALDSCNFGAVFDKIRHMRNQWSATVQAKFLSHILLNQTQNNPITSVSSPEFVEMFKEYVEMFERVVLSEFSQMVCSVNVANAAGIGDNSARDEDCKCFPLMQTRWDDVSDTSLNANKEKLDAVSANLALSNAFHNGHEMKRAHMPMPNLHILTCSPLSWDDAKNSASSVNSVMWPVQQVAGMTYLNRETCTELLRHDDKTPLNNTDEYRKFLMPCNDTFCNAAPTTMWNSFLMHWFMSYFHPNSSVRDKASALCNISTQDERELCEAIKDVLTSNSCMNNRLNSSLQRVVNAFNHPKTNDRVNAAVASSSMPFIPAQYIDFNDAKNPCTFRKANLNRVPVADVDGFVKMKYVPAGCNRYSQTEKARHKIMSQYAYSDFVYHDVDVATGNTIVELEGVKKQVYDYASGQCGMSDFDDMAYHWSTNNAWILNLQGTSVATHNMPCNMTNPASTYQEVQQKPIYDAADTGMQDTVNAAKGACQNPQQYEEILKHFVLVLFARFFESSTRFTNDGQGMGVPYKDTSQQDQVVRNGLHFMHGPYIPTHLSASEAGYGAKDIVILRPNIEHEMLGIIMGRGGTQELGCTFWGQTELSCYDDAQHGIWGMSYKYHERAMVTNEKNLIRVFDVAFDGYNGGMDQQCVDWNDGNSIQKFAEATYARDRPYTGPSMLVMALPHNPENSRCNWPNPIVFHENMGNNPTPDPQKDNLLPSVNEFMVFNSSHNPRLCTPAQEQTYKAYMNRLGMHQWSSLDATSRPAGDACVANEASTHMLAFQGTMKVYDQNGGLLEHTQGSGHLGPSYVGVASVREGRGLQNTGMAPTMIRQI